MMMLRTRSPLSVLQKTYDESYLTCSTAVYYESQGNEDEALRCWRSALDQIHDHNANKVPQNYVPRTETEKALAQSLHDLELQCKERIDLLDALRLSRQTDRSQRNPSPPGSVPCHSSDSADGAPATKGWIGDGTIPAITYPELARPPLPQRPSLPTRTSSERAVRGSSRSSSVDLGPSSAPRPSLPPYSTPGTPKKRASRSPSPERHTMKTTLRPNRLGDRPNKLTRRHPSKPADGPGASKAATLAWTALGSKDKSKDKAGKGKAVDTTSVSSQVSSEVPRKSSASFQPRWDSHSRRLVTPRESDPVSPLEGRHSLDSPRASRASDEYPFPRPNTLSLSAASSALSALSPPETCNADREYGSRTDRVQRQKAAASSVPPARAPKHHISRDELGVDDPSGSGERTRNSLDLPVRRKPVGQTPTATPTGSAQTITGRSSGSRRRETRMSREDSSSGLEDPGSGRQTKTPRRRRQEKKGGVSSITSSRAQTSDDSSEDEHVKTAKAWKKRKAAILKNLPPGVDDHAAKQILNEIVVRGDEVHWADVAGLDVAKAALKEAVVYPFLRPDLFLGLREPARGMLLFGPPGTGKTMLARAVATESKSTFFSISASSLTSKYLGESEKLVRALFALAKVLAPSIIFVDEIDSLLSQRSGSGEHESTRRIKTEFLIQWSDLQRAAAGRDPGEKDRERGDANRVLVLAATNLPWAIDEAARRRFVRRQYIPLPEVETRKTQLKTLLGQQKHNLSDAEIDQLVELTEGFSGSDITALAKDAAMGPLRSLGEALLQMSMEEIRPIGVSDFVASLSNIRPSVSKAGLREYEEWAREFGERAG